MKRRLKQPPFHTLRDLCFVFKFRDETPVITKLPQPPIDLLDFLIVHQRIEVHRR